MSIKSNSTPKQAYKTDADRPNTKKKYKTDAKEPLKKKPSDFNEFKHAEEGK
jgi:hypothetical protein